MGFATLKRDAGNPISNKFCITNSAFSKHAKNQQVSAYNHSFLTIIQTYGCKEILVTLLHAKKCADAAMLHVFIIGFPASLFDHVQSWIDPR